MKRLAIPALIVPTLIALSALFALGARAADTTAPAPAAAEPLAAAQSHIKSERWAKAIAELKRVNLVNDADWNNLMGYALRKQASPDLDGAQRHYDAALRINPNHLGALEYAGELALMKKDLPAAEDKLARLSQLCQSPCEQLDDLKKAVADYKAKAK